MAGEWLKFEASTPEKREVFSITTAMGWDDPDLTVGKLLKVWRWFDQQTIDGNAPSVTLALLDRIIGVSGFAKAMCDVGWLAPHEDGISLPNFDRHNGKTAKERCLTAKRVAKHKSNAGGNGKGNAKSVSSPLPKEEKRREEKIYGSGGATSDESALPPEDHPALMLGAEPSDYDAPKAAPLPTRETPPASEDPAVQLSIRLRRLGVTATFTHPDVLEWAKQGVSAEAIEQAVQIARERKGDAPIPVGYLRPILHQIQNPPAAKSPLPSADTKFHFSDVDRSGDRKAMEDSMKRRGIVIPEDGEIKI